MRNRRTVGAFVAERPIPPAVVNTALEVARWAPNHRKTEPWRAYVFGPVTRSGVIDLNSQIIARTKGPEAAATKKASWERVPGWLAITCRISADPLLAEEDYAACCCFIQNLTLSLWSEGVGSKWSTGDITRTPEFAQLVGFDLSVERCVGLVWYGYPAVTPTQSRQPVEAFTIQCP